MVGIMNSTMYLQLEQISMTNEPEAYHYIWERWILVMLEMMKSVKKLCDFDEMRKNVDPEKLKEMERQIAIFEEIEKSQAEESKFRERLEDDIMCWTDGCMNTVDEGKDYCSTCLKRKNV